MPTAGCAWRFFFLFIYIYISKESDKMAKRAEEERAKDLRPGDERKKEKEERREERRRTHIHTP